MPDTLIAPALETESPDSYLSVTASFQKPIDDEAGYDFVCVMSLDTVDDDDEVVLPRGCDLGRFSKNGPLKLCHDYGPRQQEATFYPLPVGQVISTKLRTNSIVGYLRFARSSEMGREAMGLVAEGVLRGVSVGFQVLKSSPMTAAEAKTRPDWEAAFERTKGRINVIRKWKLLELSLTDQPCNEDALIKYRAKGLVVPGWLKANKHKGKAVADVEIQVDDPEPKVYESAAEFESDRPDITAEIEAILKAKETDGFAPIPSLKSKLAVALRTKGEKLGNVGGSILASVAETLSSSMRSYLWGVAYDYGDQEGSVGTRIRAACKEFEDAAILAFEALEPLKQKRDAKQLDPLVSKLSAKAISLFGNPKTLFEAVLTKAKAPEPEPEAKDEDEEESLKPGDHVKCKAMHYKGMGVVKSVHKGDHVPNVDNECFGTKEEPAAQIQCYRKMGDGHVATKMHTGVLCKDCSKVEPMKEPTPTKKGIDITKLPALTGKSDGQIAIERIKQLKQSLHPSLIKQIIDKETDRRMGAV